MKIIVEIEANTDTELLEGLISAYNRVHAETVEFDVLKVFDRGTALQKFGSIPSYRIYKAP